MHGPGLADRTGDQGKTLVEFTAVSSTFTAVAGLSAVLCQGHWPRPLWPGAACSYVRLPPSSYL